MRFIVNGCTLAYRYAYTNKRAFLLKVTYTNAKEFPGVMCVLFTDGTFFFSHCSINSEPGSSLAIWPSTTNEVLSPLDLPSRIYSAASHSCISSHISTSGFALLIASICLLPPAAPGISSKRLQAPTVAIRNIKDGYYYIALTYTVRYFFDKYNQIAGLASFKKDKRVG